MTQEWGPSHYHFMVEHLPRITVMRDVLLQQKEIKVSLFGDRLFSGHLNSFELFPKGAAWPQRFNSNP